MHVWYSFQQRCCCCRDEVNDFQLYQSDPSGNYSGWKATAIGANHQGATNILKQEYKDDITLEEAIKLIIKVGVSSADFMQQASPLPAVRAPAPGRQALGKLCRLKGYKQQAGPAMQCVTLGRAGKHWFSQTCGREAWEHGGTTAAGRDLI